MTVVLRWLLVLVGVAVATILSRSVKENRRRGPIVLAGTIGGLLLGAAGAYPMSPSTFRVQGLDVLDICLFAGVVGGCLVSSTIASRK